MEHVDENDVIEEDSSEEIVTKDTNYVKQRDRFEPLSGFSVAPTTLDKVIFAQALIKYTN